MLKTAGRKATTAKLLATVVLVGGAASVAGLGTFGAFTSTTKADQAVASGTINLTLNGAKTVEFDDISGMVPGDMFQRPINLARGADDEKFGSLIITPNFTGDDDLVEALDVDVRTCSVAWTGNGDGTLDCAGTMSTVGAVLDSDDPITVPAASLADNLNGNSRQLNLAATFTFTSQGDEIDNTLKSLDADLGFTFTATQRDAANL